MKVKLRNKQWVKRTLHKPCIKLVKAAARFIKYGDNYLEVFFSHAHLTSGRCIGEDAFRIIPPRYKGYDPLQQAIGFFATACHELCHCQDYLEGRQFSNKGTWRKRETEKAVFDRLYDLTGGKAKDYAHYNDWVLEVKLPQYVEKAILELAMMLEELDKGY